MEELRMEELNNLINGKNIIITGGTGSFGNKLTDVLLTKFSPNKIVIFSRDEFKQTNMRVKFPVEKYPCMRYFIGDIRDYDRLDYAFNGIDVVFHAAALKQVPTLEYNPTEAIKTNIYGAENVIKAAIKNKIKKVVSISTDKSVNPVNLYGATKMCFEKLFVAANNISGDNGPQFSVLRYGNVLGSRGSVVPLFLKQKENNILTITDPDMTRFTLTLQDAIYFVLNCFSYMIGGEIFIPKLPSYNVMQIAKLIGPDCEKKIIGIRPGEKMHECMIGIAESYLALECGHFYIITPCIRMKDSQNYEKFYEHLHPKKTTKDFVYSSGDNYIIDNDKLNKLIIDYCSEYSS
jgi:UDP-N-acetylglucosamine 4,6-dehydratase